MFENVSQVYHIPNIIAIIGRSTNRESWTLTRRTTIANVTTTSWVQWGRMLSRGITIVITTTTIWIQWGRMSRNNATVGEAAAAVRVVAATSLTGRRGTLSNTTAMGLIDRCYTLRRSRDLSA